MVSDLENPRKNCEESPVAFGQNAAIMSTCKAD